MSAPPHHDPPSDAELVEKCRRGDAASWEVLAARYADFVYGIAWRAGLRGNDAGDVVQEVFLRLVENLHRIRETERLAGWIAMTARREAWRKRGREKKTAAWERAGARSEEAADPAPPETLETLEAEQAVRLAFARIPERCRRLLDALFFRDEEASYARIAEELGMAIGSLGPTRRRCLEALERELTAAGFSPPAGVSGAGVTSSEHLKRRRP